jgi:hypothetical protein
VLAAWLLALYPGAAYWGGLPYPYALIVPGSLLLTAGLARLAAADRWPTTVAWSIGMGLGYLGYDFLPFFLPASLLVLAGRQRWGAAVVSAGLQVAPLALWLLWLDRGLHVPVHNANSHVYGSILSAYASFPGWPALWAEVREAVPVGLEVLFGANFLFLPGLFVAVVALNPLTSRVSLRRPETALLLATLALFLFNNFAPPYGGTWEMRGSWIARLYQPVFPVLVLFVARWWQHLPGLPERAVLPIRLGLALGLGGNALITFGPILNNPLRLSESAFYRFYDHTDVHWVYAETLKNAGRRPLGF